MIINWYKYIRDLLPPRLRLVRLVEMVRVLVWQVPRANSEFDLMLADANYKVNVNASVVALEKLIQYELDALATIEELDGKPFDFMVNVHSAVDETRLRALVNQYKLAGKTFVFRLGAVVYTAEFINHQCEDITTLYTAEFTDYYCEQDGNNNISISISPFGFDKVRITANADLPVTSELQINGTVYGHDGEGNTYFVSLFSLTIANAAVSGLVELENLTAAYSYSVGSITVTPTSDTYFNYIIS